MENITPTHKPPFLIGTIANILRWFELLIFTISAPVLSAASVIAVVDLLTGGRLLATQPNLVFAFGVALAIGIDSQLPAACERVRDAWEASPKRWLTLLLWAVIALWTGMVIYTALRAFSIEQAQHVDEATALAIIGIDPGLFAAQRDLLAVVLLGLSGFARVKARAVTRAEEREQLQRELEMEPLRQQVEALKARRVVNAVATGRAAVDALKTSQTSEAITPASAAESSVGHPMALLEGADMPQQAAMSDTPSVTPEALQRDAEPQGEPPTRPPTGPGSPTAVPVRTPRRKAAPVLRLEAPREARKTAAQARAKGTASRPVRTPVAVANYEPQARAAWADGARSVTKMERATGMSHSAAQSWVRTLKTEAAAMAANASSQLAQ